MKPRFSLRTLLAAITVVALLAWWQTSPARLADRFIAHIEAGRYAEADQMLVKNTSRPISSRVHPYIGRTITASREPATWFDWLKGISRVRVVIVDSGGWDRYTISATVVMTRRGAQKLMWSVEAVDRGPALLPTTMGAVRQ
jgi:hypothetical protein